MKAKNSTKVMLAKLLSLFLASSLVSAPLVSCFSQTANSNTNIGTDNGDDNGNDNVDNDNNNSDNENNTDDNNSENGNNDNNQNDGNNGNGNGSENGDNNTDSDNENGSTDGDDEIDVDTSLPKEIVDSINFKNDVLKTPSANSKNLKSTVSEFLKNAEYFKMMGSKEKLDKDILKYFYELSSKYPNLKIYNLSMSSVDVDTDNPQKYIWYLNSNDVMLNDSLLTFSVQVTLKSAYKQTITLGQKTVTLERNKKYNFKIEADRQMIDSKIVTLNNNEHYLSWDIKKVTFQLDDVSWDENNFAFSNNYPSHAFYYSIKNLIEGESYFDLKKKHEASVWNDSAALTQKVQSKLNNQINLYSSYFDLATDILGALKQDISVIRMFKLISPSVVDLLVNLGIIPSSLKPFLVQSLYGNSSNGEFSDVLFIRAVYSNKNEIAEFISSLFGIGDKELILNILTFFENGLTKEVFDESFKPLLQQLQVPDNIINIIAGDILGINGYGYAKPLVKIIVDNYMLILKLVEGFVNTDVIQFDGIVALLDILFARKDASQAVTIYEAILLNSTTKKNFIDALKKLVSINSQTEKILQILVVDNTLINQQNIQNVITTLFNFLNGYFERNTSYTDITNKYKNLVVKKKVNQEVNVSKYSKWVEFDYQYTFSLRKTINLDLSVLKKLISDDSAKELLNMLVSQYNVDQKYINMALQYVGITKIKEIVLNIIPSKLQFGTTWKNDLSIRFTANRSTPWFDVIKTKGSNYNSGLSFTYNTNISFNDTGFIDSLTKNYAYGMTKAYDYIFIVSWAKLYIGYSEFWKGIIDNILYRDYDISNKMSVTTDNVIADTTNYVEKQYYYGYSYTNKMSTYNTVNFVKNLFSDKSEVLHTTVKDRYDNIHKYNWSNVSTSYYIDGQKPYLSQKNYEELKNRLFSFSQGFTNYQLSMIPTFNFQMTLPISVRSLVAGNTDVYINFRVVLLDVNLYFPFYVYDEYTKTYTNTLSRTISYFNTDVKTVSF